MLAPSESQLLGCSVAVRPVGRDRRV